MAHWDQILVYLGIFWTKFSNLKQTDRQQTYQNPTFFLKSRKTGRTFVRSLAHLLFWLSQSLLRCARCRCVTIFCTHFVIIATFLMIKIKQLPYLPSFPIYMKVDHLRIFASFQSFKKCHVFFFCDSLQGALVFTENFPL